MCRLRWHCAEYVLWQRHYNNMWNHCKYPWTLNLKYCENIWIFVRNIRWCQHVVDADGNDFLSVWLNVDTMRWVWMTAKEKRFMKTRRLIATWRWFDMKVYFHLNVNHFSFTREIGWCFSKIHLHLSCTYISSWKAPSKKRKKNVIYVQVSWRRACQFIKFHVADCDHFSERRIWRYCSEYLLWSWYCRQYRHYGEFILIRFRCKLNQLNFQSSHHKFDRKFTNWISSSLFLSVPPNYMAAVNFLNWIFSFFSNFSDYFHNMKKSRTIDFVG